MKVMEFKSPRDDVTFHIREDWWRFAEMDTFTPQNDCYPFRDSCDRPGKVKVVPIEQIEPPTRNEGVQPFCKCSLVPILLGFRNRFAELPPVSVKVLPQTDGYQYKVENGFHRYYASVAAGYTHLPVIVQ